jgi:hypothetical protein
MFKSISSFFNVHKVFILGAASALGVALQQFTSEASPDYKVVAFAGLLAVISYLAKNLTGVAASILSIVGAAVVTISSTATGAKVSWSQLILTTIVAIIGVLAPAPQQKQS